MEYFECVAGSASRQELLAVFSHSHWLNLYFLFWACWSELLPHVTHADIALNICAVQIQALSSANV